MGNVIQRPAFPAPSPPIPLDSRIQDNYKKIKTPKGHTFPLLYLPYPNAELTLVFSHGNGTDLGEITPYLQHLRDILKVNVVGYEYLGYGYSEIDLEMETSNVSCTSSSTEVNPYPSERGCYISIYCTYRYLLEALQIPEDKIILMGQSIGTGPTAHLAAKSRCRGVILVSPFRSAIKVVSTSNWLNPIDFFKNDKKVTKIKAPVFIIHGTKDSIVNFSHGEHLHHLLKKKHGEQHYPPLWIKDAGHNDLESYPEYLDSIKTFINSV